MLKETDLYKFADDNTITAVCNKLANLRFWRLKENSQQDGSEKMKCW